MNSYERDGLVFDVVDDGPRDGDVVVLLHGFPQSAAGWSEVTPLLSAAGYRTLCPDQRGYSPRARPVGRRQYAVGELVADVVALIDAAGAPKAHLVGHDWGAVVAWAVAASAPDRLRTLAAFSVPHPGAYARACLTSSQLAHSWYAFAMQLPVVPELLFSPARAPSRRLFERMLRSSGLPPGPARRDLDRMAEPGALTAAMNWYRAAPFAPLSLRAARIGVPTLYCWSDGDGFLARAGAERSGDYVDADYTFEVVAGADHWLPEKQPQLVAEMLLSQWRRPAKP